ncbi:MAG: M20/M25/M40 family metallo-hydrolase [Bacteroidales bacterium]|nr:M20/M25/M40 family metallo-hydrolase [Bacteroidales bacterium]
MRKIRVSIVTLLFSVLVGATAFAQVENDKVIDKIIEIAQNDNQTMDHLNVLCNRFGGRPIGSDAYDNAADWCEYMFKKWGLEVIRQEVGELPVGFNRGPWFGRMIGGNNMTLHFTTPSYTSGTVGVQRGHVVKEPKTQYQFERMKKTLKGAWVLITGQSSGWPIDYSEEGDAKRAKAIEEKRTDEPATFYKEMVEAGILGIIQSAKVPITTLYDRKNVEKMTFETLPTVPDIKLDEAQYKIIEDMVNRGEYFLLEFDIRNHFKMGPVKYHNIIGVLKGSEYPDEYVICGGHLDAFDVATGGVDCGTGVAPTMEAARMLALSGAKPKRTILFALWAGEEFGLLGSKYFVLSDTTKWPKISNYFNRDGGPTVPLSVTVPPAMYDDFVKVCEPINRVNPDFPFEVKKREGEPRPLPKSAGGSDHAYFQINGIPTISFNLGDPKGYNFNYREIWHTDRDLYNKSIPEYMEHASACNAIVLYGLSNLDHLLSREGLFKKEEPKAEEPAKGKKGKSKKK